MYIFCFSFSLQFPSDNYRFVMTSCLFSCTVQYIHILSFTSGSVRVLRKGILIGYFVLSLLISLFLSDTYICMYLQTDCKDL